MKFGNRNMFQTDPGYVFTLYNLIATTIEAWDQTFLMCRNVHMHLAYHSLCYMYFERPHQPGVSRNCTFTMGEWSLREYQPDTLFPPGICVRTSLSNHSVLNSLFMQACPHFVVHSQCTLPFHSEFN